MNAVRRWRDGGGTLRIAASGTHGSSTYGSSTNGSTTYGSSTPGEPPPSIPLEIAASYRARTRGLLGRDGLDGALLLTPATSVHTVRMRFAIDVAYLDRRLRVLAVRTMPPGRLGRPRLRARHVLEAEAGAMERWGVRRGVRLEIGME
ncbi:DUF192 domain-containing protein [Streptomyces sp. H39-S7]|uniref:DUF192 domain-containing protein n=1 Tax=Streptomyces sp. H39-S7 TaxID=3004357 RepID=UPI003FA698CA